MLEGAQGSLCFCAPGIPGKEGAGLFRTIFCNMDMRGVVEPIFRLIWICASIVVGFSVVRHESCRVVVVVECDKTRMERLGDSS